MKTKVNELTDLEVLEMELKLIDEEIKKLEEARGDSVTCYMEGRPYTMDQVYGMAADSNDRFSHSFSLMMTEADKNELRLDDLKKMRKDIMLQIEEEKAKQAMGFGA